MRLHVHGLHGCCAACRWLVCMIVVGMRTMLHAESDCRSWRLKGNGMTVLDAQLESVLVL